MSYKLWVGETDETCWVPEKPMLALDRLPPGASSVLRPENKKGCKLDTMTKAVKQLSPCMRQNDLHWWDKFVSEETNKHTAWDSMNDREYKEAGESFDITSLQYAEYSSEDDTDNKDFK